jgi:pimeloyl-ACP methyl ester carboxylesterase
MASEHLHYELHRVEKPAAWMVFVHGAGGSTRTWQKQVEFFKGKFNLLLVDLRDHGNSKNMDETGQVFDFPVVAADVLKVMDLLEIREAHFIGVSMGSIIIRHIEQMAPKRVTSVVLAGGIFKMSRKIKMLAYLARTLTSVLPFQTLYQGFALVLLPRNNHAASRRVFIREAKKLQRHEARKWLRLVKRLNKTLRDLFSQRINSPCLVVMGAQDHVFLGPAQQYVAKYGEVFLEVIDKCGHVCNIERAAEFNQRCFNFIVALENKRLTTTT